MPDRRLVSVIIPTYNRANLLPRALKSVLSQTYQPLEVIVVDDASQDNTSEVVEGFGEGTFRYIRHEENKGGSAARNTGIRAARGKFIAFLDSDDAWTPNKLERTLEVFASDPECGVVYSAHRIIRGSGTTEAHRANNPEGWIRAELLKSAVVGTTSAVVVRRNCFARAGLFDESLPSCQDWDMWIRIAEHCKFRRISEPLVRYYWHGDQISTNFDATYQGRMAIWNKYEREIRQLGGRVVAFHQVSLGHRARQMGQMDLAREHYWKALTSRPAWRYLVFAGLSLFGSSAYASVMAIRNWWKLRAE